MLGRDSVRQNRRNLLSLLEREVQGALGGLSAWVAGAGRQSRHPASQAREHEVLWLVLSWKEG